MTSPRELLIVSHVVHYRHGGRLFAYGPYAREIDIWADLFPRVTIAAPCRDEGPPGDCLPFSRANIAILPQKETGGETLGAKVALAAALPALAWGLVRAMRRAEAIHVRCPGNIGLLGAALGALFSRRLVAKYAGQWSDYRGEPVTSRLQKAILRSRWWGGPVTVYGRWPGQPPHVIPFFTSILTADQAARAQAVAGARRPGGPLRVLYVGRLSRPKNVDSLIDSIKNLDDRSCPCECALVGDGPQRPALEAQVAAHGLQGRVRLVGSLSFERVLDFYEWADVLVLASETEGWPKAIAEGMAFGLVCIGSDRGLIPQMLGEGRGVVVPPGDVASLTEALGRLAAAPDDREAIRAAPPPGPSGIPSKACGRPSASCSRPTGVSRSVPSPNRPRCDGSPCHDGPHRRDAS